MIDLTKPLQTRSGEPVEIITTEGREPYPVVGYIGDSEAVSMWDELGALSEIDNEVQTEAYDLINTPVQREGWVVVWSDSHDYDLYDRILDTYEQAARVAEGFGVPAKITWKE